jgi:hypothetical protein
MAVHARPFTPLQQARMRRSKLFRHWPLDRGRYLLATILLLCLMSLLTLGQTGVVATRGYAVTNLEMQHRELMRVHNQLEVRYAEAQSLGRIRKRAEQLGLRPIQAEQVRYMMLEAHPHIANESPRVRVERELAEGSQTGLDDGNGE